MAQHGINHHEVQQLIDRLGDVGRTADGLYRPVYGTAWREACELIEEEFSRAGLSTHRDTVGNVFGRLDGSEGGRTVLTGSHVDTVRNGGKYDGALGIVAGLYAIKACAQRYDLPHFALEVVALCEEEGSRFPTNFLGSRSVCGLLTDGDLSEIRDSDGISIREAMTAVGLRQAPVIEARRTDIEAFIELHIEQGPVLEQAGRDIGIPPAISGLRWFEVTVVGEQGHAGTTPMELRADPVAGTAAMIQQVTEYVRGLGHPAVATVGRVQVTPGSVNVIAGEVIFTIDLRHGDSQALRGMSDAMTGLLHELAMKRGLHVRTQLMLDQAPTDLDPTLRGVVKELCVQSGYSWLEFPSGAGHDSVIFAKQVPTAMIFVPSTRGRSHVPDEETPIDQVVPGIDLLAQTLHRLAYA